MCRVAFVNMTTLNLVDHNGLTRLASTPCLLPKGIINIIWRIVHLFHSTLSDDILCGTEVVSIPFLIVQLIGPKCFFNAAELVYDAVHDATHQVPSLSTHVQKYLQWTPFQNPFHGQPTFNYCTSHWQRGPISLYYLPTHFEFYIAPGMLISPNRVLVFNVSLL